MTIDDIEAMDCNVLTVKTVAEFLGKDPQVIRDQAEREPKYLGFPICKAGHSYCIPRIGFINWYKFANVTIVCEGKECGKLLLY